MGGNNLFVYLPTNKTPGIRFSSSDKDKSLYVLSVEGRAIPENPTDFFNPVIDKLMNRIPNKGKNNKIIIDLKLDYINSISVKFFIKMFRELKERFEFENIVINWYYEDDDTYDLGKDLEFMTGLDFNFVDMDM